MHIHFNHHISCISDIISMIISSDPDVTVSASHKRLDHGLGHILDHVTPELQGDASGQMPDQYVSWLIETAQREKADVVIPYLHRHELSLHKGAFEMAGLKLITAGDYKTMGMIEEKTSFLSIATSLGILVSPFISWETEDQLESSISHFKRTFPAGTKLCIKPSRGIYGEGFRILYDEDDGNSFRTAMRGQDPVISMQSLSRIVRNNGAVKRMMTMPFLPGLERSVDFACLEGRLLGAVTREKHGNFQTICHNPEAVAVVVKLVEALGLSGLANIQTLEGADGRQHLLEMNSRAAGGIGMTAYSSVNLPGLLVSALKNDTIVAPSFPEGDMQIERRTQYAAL